MAHTQFDRQSSLARNIALLAAVITAAVTPALALGWGSSGGSSWSSSGSNSRTSGGSYGGGTSNSAPSTPNSCPPASNAPLNVHFTTGTAPGSGGTQGCFTCHSQGTGCTDPNQACIPIADNSHHIPADGALGCLVCHTVDPKTPAGVTFFTDCIHCHETTGAITRQQFPVELPGHTVDTHRIVRDACGQCHKDPVPVIHARVAGGGQEWSGSHSGSSWSGHSTGGGTASASGEAAACFFCHVNNAQRAAVVQAGIAKGCAACSNCHGNR